MNNKIQSITDPLFFDIRKYINDAKQLVATTTNSTITVMYWNIGFRINQEILNNERAEYGKQIVKKLSEKLTFEFGKGWSDKQLRHCLRFAETFPDKEIVYALSRQLSWTHFRILMYINNELGREFYLEMCRLEKWTTRTLNEKVDSMLFERTAISKKPDNQTTRFKRN